MPLLGDPEGDKRTVVEIDAPNRAEPALGDGQGERQGRSRRRRMSAPAPSAPSATDEETPPGCLLSPRTPPQEREGTKGLAQEAEAEVCIFCKDGSTTSTTRTSALRKFVSERGKIRARRGDGQLLQHQRDVATAVKNAREMAHPSVFDAMNHPAKAVDKLASPATSSRLPTATPNYLVPRGFAQSHQGWERHIKPPASHGTRVNKAKPRRNP